MILEILQELESNNSRNFKIELQNLFKNTINFDKIKSEFRANNYKIVENAGYDEYYLLRAEGLNYE